MTKGTDALKSAFRDHVTGGVPASGEHEPEKSEIRNAVGAIGAEILAAAAATSGDGLQLIVDTIKPLTDSAEINADRAETAVEGAREATAIYGEVAFLNRLTFDPQMADVTGVTIAPFEENRTYLEGLQLSNSGLNTDASIDKWVVYAEVDLEGCALKVFSDRILTIPVTLKKGRNEFTTKDFGYLPVNPDTRVGIYCFKAGVSFRNSPNNGRSLFVGGNPQTLENLQYFGSPAGLMMSVDIRYGSTVEAVRRLDNPKRNAFKRLWTFNTGYTATDSPVDGSALIGVYDGPNVPATTYEPVPRYQADYFPRSRDGKITGLTDLKAVGNPKVVQDYDSSLCYMIMSEYGFGGVDYSTAGSTVMKSTDGGINWQQISRVMVTPQPAALANANATYGPSLFIDDDGMPYAVQAMRFTDPTTGEPIGRYELHLFKADLDWQNWQYVQRMTGTALPEWPIDGQVVKRDGKYWLFAKNEKLNRLFYATSDSLTGTWDTGREFTELAQAQLEAPQPSWEDDGTFRLYCDAFNGEGFGYYEGKAPEQPLTFGWIHLLIAKNNEHGKARAGTVATLRK